MRQEAEAGETGERHRAGRGLGNGRGEQVDADRAVAAIHARAQHLIGEQARQIGAAAAGAFELAAAAAAGETAPPPPAAGEPGPRAPAPAAAAAAVAAVAAASAAI